MNVGQSQLIQSTVECNFVTIKTQKESARSWPRA